MVPLMLCRGFKLTMEVREPIANSAIREPTSWGERPSVSQYDLWGSVSYDTSESWMLAKRRTYRHYAVGIS